MKRIQDMDLSDLEYFKEVLLHAPKTEGNQRQLERVEKLIAAKEAGE